MVFCRGSLPCDVLFCGEAPGESENVIGQPFVGPAGKLMDYIVARALEDYQAPGTEGPGYNSVRWAFTNVVACIPRDPESGGKAGEPTPDEIRACKGRLAEMVAIARPRLVVAVGTLARDWLDGKMMSSKRSPYAPLADAGYSGKVASVDHPAYILRLNVAMKGLAVQRAVVAIRSAVEEMMESDRCPG